jgi:hypothetical protein
MRQDPEMAARLFLLQMQPISPNHDMGYQNQADPLPEIAYQISCLAYWKGQHCNL